MSEYRFSFGPWNISEGADPFGPTIRPAVEFAAKIDQYKDLGFDAVQLHDDDAVPDVDNKSPDQLAAAARDLKRVLDDRELTAEIVAPRLWEDPRGVDGGYTSNDPAARQWAIDRSRRACDIARELDCDLMVLWLAREGTYIRESKNPIAAHGQLIAAVNAILEHDPRIRIAIEPKPNEPMDHAYLPTVGHALWLGSRASDPARVGCLIETAHSLLAGLDPSDDMAMALQADKLWSVHLNDQNGLKYDQDKSFGSSNLRVAFNQVRVLELGSYADSGRCVGLDVKAMRTTSVEHQVKHLRNSREFFLALIEKVRTFDQAAADQLIEERDYEELERMVMRHLLGV